MRTCRRPETVRHLQDSGDTGAESDAVVRARDIVVHRLRDGYDLEPFIVKPHRIAECVIPAYRDEVVDAEEGEVAEDLGSQIIDFIPILVPNVRRNIRFRHVAWPGARSMQKGAAGPADPIDDFFGQRLVPVTVVGRPVRHDLHDAGPAPTDPDDLISLALGANRDGPDRRIETRYVASSRQNPDDSLSPAGITHDCCPLSGM